MASDAETITGHVCLNGYCVNCSAIANSSIDLDAKMTNRTLDLRMTDTIDMMCRGSNMGKGTGAGHERKDADEF